MYNLNITMMIIIIINFFISATSSIEGIALSKSTSNFQFWKDIPNSNFTFNDCISETHDCHYIKYFFQLQQLYDKLFSKTSIMNSSTKQTRIEVISNENAYSNSFGKYIMKNRPFKGIFTSGNISEQLLLTSQLNQAIISYYNKLASTAEVSNRLKLQTTPLSFVELGTILSENPILDISDVLDNVVIPKYATNNYLRRIKQTCLSKKEEIEVNNSDNNNNSVDCHLSNEYFTKWPSIRFISLNNPTSGYKCPANMHNLLWTYTPASSASASTKGIKVQIRIFPVESSMSSYFTLATDSFNESIFHMNNVKQPIHYNEFMQDGFPHIHQHQRRHDLDNPLPAFSETTLALHQHSSSSSGGGEYLYVPNTFISSILCTLNDDDDALRSDGTTTTDTEQEVTCPIINLCFVDASNLNMFRNAMSIHGNIFPKEHNIFQELTPLKTDLGMWKDPSDMTLKEYASNNHNINQASSDHHPLPASSSVQEAVVESEAAVAVSLGKSATTATGRDRRKRTGKKSEFRDWQDLNKWNAMINALILPIPSIPQIVNKGRDNVTINWYSAFVPSVFDNVNFGFKIIYCTNTNESIYRVEEFLISSTPSFSISNDSTSTCGVSIFSRALGNLKEQIDLELLKHTGYETTFFTATLLHCLDPNTIYQLRLILFYDQAESPPSLFSKPFKTEVTTVPSIPLPYSNSLSTGSILKFSDMLLPKDMGEYSHAILQFVWPIDDGGYPILGFHVYCRHYHSSSSQYLLGGTGAAAVSQWDWLGLFPATIQRELDSNSIGTIEISNLLPNIIRLYQFKISACNKLGNSHYSVYSNIQKFTTLSNGAIHKIYGQGHRNYKGLLTQDYLNSLSTSSSSLSSLSSLISPSTVVIDPIISNYKDDVILSCRQAMLHIESFDEVITLKTCNEITTERRNDFRVSETATESLRSHNIWRSHWTSPYLSITAEFVIAKPIFLDNTITENNSSDYMKGRIVLCLRGVVPFTEKALRAQGAGAIALLVVDDGHCENYDQKCLFGANKHNNEGFGQLDIKSHWDDIEIPVYFILGHYIYDMFENININSYDENYFHAFKNRIVGYHNKDEL